MAGIEFVGFATRVPQAFGQLLETIGFRPVARHRSREVMLYRQGTLNIIVNTHLGNESGAAPGAAPSASGQPVISAFALRVRDAGAAYQRASQLGAWSVPVRVEPMELHIPAIHGAGPPPRG